MMPRYHKKLQGLSKGIIQFDETEQASEPGMAGMLELLDSKFKMTMINIVRALMDKLGSMQNRWAM